ncbi:MAG: hypothetical protein IKF82_00615 [Bacilli bacterium]|nr:hypothetical protein [Bacilli bacterium]
MYSEFQENLMYALLSYKIINIYTIDEKIVIGDAGVSKDDVVIRPFGFYIKSFNAAKWYSFLHIKKIEVYGHEF